MSEEVPKTQHVELSLLCSEQDLKRVLRACHEFGLLPTFRVALQQPIEESQPRTRVTLTLIENLLRIKSWGKNTTDRIMWISTILATLQNRDNKLVDKDGILNPKIVKMTRGASTRQLLVEHLLTFTGDRNIAMDIESIIHDVVEANTLLS